MATLPKLSTSELIEIAIDDIFVGPNLRKKSGSIVKLSQSIGELGLIHPLIVTDRHDYSEASGKPYMLVAGSRRLKALEDLGVKKVPVRIAPVSDIKTIMRVQYDENEERSDLDAWESSKSRINDVQAQLELMLLQQPEERRGRLREQAKGTRSGTEGKKLLRDARAAAGVQKDVSTRDYHIDRLVGKYPELARWSQRPLLAAGEAMNQVAPEERPALRMLAGAFDPERGKDVAPAIVNLVNKWTPETRAKLLKHVKSDPKSVLTKAFGMPPIPDDRLIEVGAALDVVRELVKKYGRRHDEAGEEISQSFKHLEAAYNFLRLAFKRVQDEFNTFDEEK